MSAPIEDLSDEGVAIEDIAHDAVDRWIHGLSEEDAELFVVLDGPARIALEECVVDAFADALGDL